MKPLVRAALTCSFTVLAFFGDAHSFPGYEEVREELDSVVKNGHPLVVHLIVPLCDNLNQGIVPVPKSLGDGKSPRSNLYWGAMYGVRHFMINRAGWSQVGVRGEVADGILERLVLHDQILRGTDSVDIYVVAEAWDGSKMREAIDRFMTLASGHQAEKILVMSGADTISIEAGGNSQLVMFAGHNGLMDARLGKKYTHKGGGQVQSVAVLCCFSESYFSSPLAATGAYPVLLTTGLMAPEAYTIDALIRSWASGESPDETRDAAASAYDRYQKCGIRAARNLFVTAE